MKCPLASTNHFPCGIYPPSDEANECQFRWLCQQMQEDAERMAILLKRLDEELKPDEGTKLPSSVSNPVDVKGR